jgi:hypothetical protein
VDLFRAFWFGQTTEHDVDGSGPERWTCGESRRQQCPMLGVESTWRWIDRQMVVPSLRSEGRNACPTAGLDWLAALRLATTKH